MDAHLNRVLFSGAFLKVAACAVFSAGLPLAVYAESGSASVTEVVQQTKTVTGLVVDSKGETIIGANIMEKGTSNGTITDFEGKFKLNVSPGGTLVVSYIGFKSVELPVNQLLNPEVGKTYTITLKEDTEVIDEVVVIGYGTQRKGDVTSAIASVKAEDFTIGKIGDAADLIKGKVAGLTIAKGTGDPNSTSTIRLRGVISVNGSTTPLVLVDGVEGDLGTVAPENIESIDVLKDASAAAIYGTRGANGVILITTKNGKRGERATASYSGYVSASQFGKKLEFMDAADVRAGLTNFTDKGYDTDWLDAISRTGFTHNHNFNITGGTEKTTYSADFTYRKEDGVIMNTYAEDIHMRFDVSHWMLNDMLRVNLNMVKKWHKNSASNVTASDGSNTSYSAYRQAIARNPTAPIYNEDGSQECEAHFNESPVVVLVDTEIIMNAPARFLVAGMGDCLSTYFGARVVYDMCRKNDLGGGPTETSMALCRLSYDLLLKHGVAAKVACENKVMTPDLNKIIEANVLLSGLGMESGGGASDHAFYYGICAITTREETKYHGEYVSFSVLCMLNMEGAPKEEIDEVYKFCLSVGLPVCLEDLDLGDLTDEEFDMFVNGVLEQEGPRNHPFPITYETVLGAIKTADALGKLYKDGQYVLE